MGFLKILKLCTNAQIKCFKFVQFGGFSMFKEKFIDLCAKKGVSPSFACSKIGISPAAFSQWTSETVPRKVTQLKAAEFFGVSVDYLLGVEDEKKPPEKEVLPEGLEDLAELYSKLTPEMRETMAALLSSLGDLPEDRQQFVVQAVRLALGRQ